MEEEALKTTLEIGLVDYDTGKANHVGKLLTIWPLVLRP